jgi:hypothetical protein
VAWTQAIFYRDESGREPVDEFIEELPVKRAVKIEGFIDEHLNGRVQMRRLRGTRPARKSKASSAS